VIPTRTSTWFVAMAIHIGGIRAKSGNSIRSNQNGYCRFSLYPKAFKLFLSLIEIGVIREGSRDETIWRYIDTVSIRLVTIRIVAQRDISRYDPDICNQGKSLRCRYFSVRRVVRIRSRNIISVGVCKTIIDWLAYF